MINKTRVTGFHLRVEEDVRNQLATFGIPPHLVEFERGPSIGQRATFMVLIDGQELFDKPKMIEHIQSALLDGLDIARACIAFAKTMAYNKKEDVSMDSELDEDDGDEISEDMEDNVVVQEVSPRPQRAAAARDGRKSPRKKFGNITKDRHGYKRPKFISRMIDR